MLSPPLSSSACIRAILAARIWDSLKVCAETMLASMSHMDGVEAIARMGGSSIKIQFGWSAVIRLGLLRDCCRIGAGESYEMLHYAAHGQGKAGSGLGQ